MIFFDKLTIEILIALYFISTIDIICILNSLYVMEI